MAKVMKVVWPRGKHLKPLPAALERPATPEERIRQMVTVLPRRAAKTAATTATDPRMAPAAISPARLKELLAGMPDLPKPEPIEVTPAQMEALKMLPAPPEGMTEALTKEMALTGMAVAVITAGPASSAIEILRKQQYQAMMLKQKLGK